MSLLPTKTQTNRPRPKNTINGFLPRNRLLMALGLGSKEPALTHEKGNRPQIFLKRHMMNSGSGVQCAKIFFGEIFQGQWE